MSEITIHTGAQGDVTIIHVDWFDENNVHRETVIELKISERDKPRSLMLSANGIELSEFFL